MKTTLFLAALAAVAAPLAAQDFKWSGAVASGKTLEIRGINGSVRAVASQRVSSLRHSGRRMCTSPAYTAHRQASSVRRGGAKASRPAASRPKPASGR